MSVPAGFPPDLPALVSAKFAAARHAGALTLNHTEAVTVRAANIPVRTESYMTLPLSPTVFICDYSGRIRILWDAND